jgi:hypothetical protein
MTKVGANSALLQLPDHVEDNVPLHGIEYTKEDNNEHGTTGIFNVKLEQAKYKTT